MTDILKEAEKAVEKIFHRVEVALGFIKADPIYVETPTVEMHEAQATGAVIITPVPASQLPAGTVITVPNTAPAPAPVPASVTEVTETPAGPAPAAVGPSPTGAPATSATSAASTTTV